MPDELSSSTSIHWVNHASFMLEHGSVGVLSDPWLTGTAFDDGWALYSESSLPPAVLDAVTHIWLSHEHPDHFSPPSLKRIPEERRAEITVLYQPTRDHLVLGYCEKLGFKTQVLERGHWVALGGEVSVWLEPWSSGDSILAIKTDVATVLNVNDAVLASPESLALLKRRLGDPHIDVLLSQFSYANWEGNPADRERRRAAAASKIDALVAQTQSFQPRHVIPFASFVYFCHEENDYLNDEVNRVSVAAKAVATRTKADPVVLYPGDRWVVGQPWPGNERAEQRYDGDLDLALTSAERVSASVVPMSSLQVAADSFIETLEEVNGSRVLALLGAVGVLGEAHLWLLDEQRAVRFDTAGLTEAPDHDEGDCDLVIGSESLEFCFKHLYGGATLQVNGRFRVPEGSKPARFRRYLQLAALNNREVSVLRSAPEVARKVGQQILARLPRRQG